MKVSYRNFEWDEYKELENMEKHGTSFQEAMEAFFDDDRIISQDLKHSETEKRYYCIGKVQDKIITVRFTYRAEKVRIIGAGCWRKGRKEYEEKSQKN